jgi:hypothetical protein
LFVLAALALDASEDSIGEGGRCSSPTVWGM